jgi:HSP20 family protein
MSDINNEMEGMRREMEQILSHVLGGRQVVLPAKHTCKPARSALANLKEHDNNVVASFEMPGVDKKDIELNIKEDSIEVKAFKSAEKEIKSSDSKEKSCKSIRFYRALGLPAKVDVEKAKAEYKDGILTVEMPKTEIVVKKTIEIQ